MKLRSLVNCTFLALVFIAQYPSSGIAEDRSPAMLLREASSNAARIDDDGAKRVALLGIMAAQEKLGDEVGAIKTVEREPIPGNRDNAWATVVAIQASKGNVAGATQSLAKISTKIARANAQAPIAVAYAAAGDIPKALQVAEQIPGNYYAYGDAFFRIAAIQAAAGDVPGALHTVADKWHLNPYRLIPIIQAQLSTGSINQAVQLTKVTDDQYLKSYLLLAVATQVKDRKRQLDIAATIPVEGVKALTYKEIAESQLAEGDVRGCLSSLTIATEAAPATSNNFARADLRWRIAAIFARAHDISNARKVAMTIEIEGHRNSALREIIEIQARAQDYDGALQTASLGTGEESLTDYALNRIAARQIVVEPVNKVMSTIARIKSGESRRIALASVAETAGEAGRIVEALSLVQLHRLAVAEALKFVETPGSLKQVRNLDDQASKLFSEAHLFQYALAGVLSKIALSRARDGALQEALGYALLIPGTNSESGRTLESLAFNQAKGGDVDGVFRWITAAQLPSQKAFALKGVASALLQKEKK
jgi:tetratricopeptide (TPR) repeat protein